MAFEDKNANAAISEAVPLSVVAEADIARYERIERKKYGDREDALSVNKIVLSS